MSLKPGLRSDPLRQVFGGPPRRSSDVAASGRDLQHEVGAAAELVVEQLPEPARTPSPGPRTRRPSTAWPPRRRAHRRRRGRRAWRRAPRGDGRPRPSPAAAAACCRPVRRRRLLPNARFPSSRPALHVAAQERAAALRAAAPARPAGRSGPRAGCGRRPARSYARPMRAGRPESTSGSASPPKTWIGQRQRRLAGVGVAVAEPQVVTGDGEQLGPPLRAAGRPPARRCPRSSAPAGRRRGRPPPGTATAGAAPSTPRAAAPAEGPCRAARRWQASR